MLPKTEEVWKKRKKTPKKRTITWSVLVASSLSLMSAYLKRMKHQHNCAIRARLRDFDCDSPNVFVPLSQVRDVGALGAPERCPGQSDEDGRGEEGVVRGVELRRDVRRVAEHASNDGSLDLIPINFFRLN